MWPPKSWTGPNPGEVCGRMESRRILIYGVTGSGKSTLAVRLSRITGISGIAVDELTWQQDWVPVPADLQRQRIAQVCAQDSWILDHGYGAWLDLVLPRAELIVALDYPRWRSFWRLLRRTTGRVLRRTPACNGNVETLRRAIGPDSILRWHFRSFASKRERISRWSSDPESPELLRLRSPDQTRRWLRQQARGAVRL